jgi:hypothetical protein
MPGNPFVGSWTYRSLLNDPDIATQFNDLQFGRATLVIEEDDEHVLSGTIGGSGWLLALRGSRGYGYPMQVRFQGTGRVNDQDWAYDYIGWLVPVWPNSNTDLQRAAIVGSVVRTLPHAAGGGVAPAGFVASFYAVRQD